MVSQPLPQIDPVELMMISIGIRSLITKKIERITKGQLDEMMTLPAKVVRLSKQIVAGESFETTFGNDNYRALLTDLAKGWDLEQAQAMLSQVPTEYHIVASAVLVKTSQLMKEMDQEYPVNRYITMSGETRLAPSDAKMFRFLSVLECIDRPLVVFELMSTGAILQSQVEAIRTVYPALAAAIDTSLIDSIARARSVKQSFQLPPRAERGVRAWFGKGPVPLAVMKRAQETAKTMAAKQEANRPAPQSSSQANRPSLTMSQKTETV